MNQKKKACRTRGLGSDPGLDLAISRFTNSLAYRYVGQVSADPGAALTR
jgi:hypothetical protein